MRIIIVHVCGALGGLGHPGTAIGRRRAAIGACLALLMALVLATPAWASPLGVGGAMTPAQRDYERERLEGLARRSGPLRVLDIMQSLQAPARTGPVPTVMPIAIGLITSSFGMRIDPITRSRALHEGQDFAAPAGTPILAAASGVVVDARTHPEYGQMIDIDHGNELLTRYAHASALLVRRGDLVRRGQQIALVGSTGRSTGAHLHFEVRNAGVAVDPVRFLGDQARPATLASAIGER